MQLYGQAQHGQQTNRQIGDIHLPPAVAMGGVAPIGVVIVVPPFAVRDQGHEPVIAAVLIGLVGAVAPNMRQRIHAPRDMPYGHGADEDAPYQQARAELRRFARLPVVAQPIAAPTK